MKKNYEAVAVIDGKLAIHYDENGNVFFIEVLTK